MCISQWSGCTWGATFAPNRKGMPVLPTTCFPACPRPNLRRAQRIVRPFCTANSVTYTETTLCRSYGIVIRHLNHGLRAAAPSSARW